MKMKMKMSDTIGMLVACRVVKCASLADPEAEK